MDDDTLHAATPSPTLPATTAQPTASMLVQLTTDGVPKLHCPVCNKALVSLNGYVKHLKKHEPPGGFLCRYCDARFCSEDELKRHRDEVHTTIACRICKDVTFTKVEEYRAHIRDLHNGIDRELYKCEKCGAEYKTIEPYKRHMDTQCGTIKPHKCEQCHMSFVTKYNLKQHKESHSGERRYCCSYCGKNFMQKGRLVEHERSHTGEKPYKCDVCGKCFAHRESIVTHSSIHTGVRLVECRCCLSRFSCYSNLIKHRRTRPDNCGLPQYDPPKNRIRTHRSRIPPTLNPTSEIKVSNFNKIIKPDVKEIVRKSPKKEPVELNGLCHTTRKRAGRGPGRPPKKKRKMSTESENEEAEDVLCDSYDSPKRMWNTPTLDIPKRETRLTRASAAQNTIEIDALATMANVPKQEKAEPWNESDDDEDYIEFDPVDSESDEDHKEDVKLPTEEASSIKKELPDAGTDLTVAHILLCNNDDDGLEFCDEREFVSEDVNVKSEEGTNIFNDKDKLIECLLKESEAKKNGIPVRNTKEPQSGDVKEECDILEETEVVLIKDEHSETFATEEVDMLDVKFHTEADFGKCKIRLEDVKQRFPKFKGQSNVKVGRKAKSQLRLRKQQQSPQPANGRESPDKLKKTHDPTQPTQPTQRRKYRKRHERHDPTAAPGRVAKLTQQQLKARLKMMKQEETAWHCPHCIKVYYMRKPFEKHLRDHHQRPEDEIQKAFRTDVDGLANGDVFRCDVCDKMYLVEKRLIAHKKLHGPDGNLIFKCPCYCSQYFAAKDEAMLHAQQQHRELIYCNICEKFMTGHDSLKNHMRAIHQCDSKTEQSRCVTRNLVCDKCGKKFSGRTSLTDHVRSDCGRKPLYQCTVCGKHLTTAGILKTHLLLHKDETPYQCDQCGKTFKVKAQYKTHIKTRHTDFKPFKCHLCPKAYPYRESLLTHMTVHTGIKRFLCNGCGKRFTCISNLQAHRKVHADTCGLLPLNAKATQYMGVQKGNLLLGAKPEAGVDYKETNTLLAKEVIDRDLPAAQELNYPSEPTAPLATVPLNYTQATTQHLLMPQVPPSYADDSHSHASSYN